MGWSGVFASAHSDVPPKDFLAAADPRLAQDDPYGQAGTGYLGGAGSRGVAEVWAAPKYGIKKSFEYKTNNIIRSYKINIAEVVDMQTCL